MLAGSNDMPRRFNQAPLFAVLRSNSTENRHDVIPRLPVGKLQQRGVIGSARVKQLLNNTSLLPRLRR